MERPPRVPNLISKRVLQKWEDLVRAALGAEEPKESFVGDEYGLGYESSASSAAVPQSLSHRYSRRILRSLVYVSKLVPQQFFHFGGTHETAFHSSVCNLGPPSELLLPTHAVVSQQYPL